MKKHHFFIVLTVSLVVLLASAAFAQPGMPGRKAHGWGHGSTYGRMYNPNTVETLSGEVKSVEKITPLMDMSYGIHLMLQTDREAISVHLGPAWYVENQEEKIEPHDQIEVSGSRITLEGKPIIIAARIKRGEDMLVLRDENGFPRWAGWHAGGRGGGKGCCWQMTGSSSGMSDANSLRQFDATVLRVDKVDSKRGNWKGIHLLVKTGGEGIPVHLGPEWFIQKHGFQLSEGDEIKIAGFRITYDQKPAIIAAEIRKSDQVLTLRNEYGLPTWRGWRQGYYQ